jgi:hypothetical protein
MEENTAVNYAIEDCMDALFCTQMSMTSAEEPSELLSSTPQEKVVLLCDPRSLFKNSIKIFNSGFNGLALPIVLL